MKCKVIAIACVLSLASVGLAKGVELDPGLQSFRPAGGAAGSIKSVGSDTMNNLMTLWAEEFKKHYPNVSIEIEGKGSSTAPPALIAGQSTFGPMSRAMKSSEVDKFEAAFGYKPTELRTSIDMLAVYVHKDNPIKGLSLQQIDAIFSKTRKGGAPSDITTWGQVGLTGEWANRPITIYGRNPASGTYGYFKKKALFKGDYKDTVKAQPGSSAVVSSIAADMGAIGYSGIGYKTADVRAIPLTRNTGDALVSATSDNAYNGEYPLARFLYLSVNYKPGSTLDPLRAEFLRLVFSRQGQAVVLKDGYFPITARLAEIELGKVGLVAGSPEPATSGN